MEYIKRKVHLTKYLTLQDSSGENDTLVFKSIDKIIQIPLTQSYDDMGVYDVSVDIIDINDI